MRALVLLLLASCVVVRVSSPRAPVYDCAAEDGSGRTVRITYAGDPVELSEGLADEPGGLWSCYRAPREQPHASATRALLDLRFAAETANAASCSPYPWRPLNLEECR
jgi:hypothetical protein